VKNGRRGGEIDSVRRQPCLAVKRAIVTRQTEMKTVGQNDEICRLLVEGMPGLVWLARADGFVEYFSPRSLDYLGKAAAEVCGWGWRNLVHPDDVACVQAGWDRAVQCGKPYEAEYRMRRNDGAYRWQAVRSLPVRRSDAQVQKWVGACADIDDQKRAHDERHARVEAVREDQEDRARLAAIVESSDDAIIGKTLQGIITSWNEGAERLFGYTADEMIGQPVSRLIPADRLDEEPDILARLRRGERVKHFETVRRRKDGSMIDVSLSSSPIRDGCGRIVGASKIARDVSGRKLAEAALEQANEQLRALTARLHEAREEEGIRIARELHDQLGRCLTTMKLDIGWIERMLSSSQAPSEGAGALLEKAREIGQAVDETIFIVRRIAAELRPGVLDDLGLAAAIEWQAQDFQKRSGVVCVLSVPDEDWRISRDQATALFRIFQESLTNVARHARATKVWVHLAEENGAIVLEVEDDGVGISLAQVAERHSLGLLGMRERAAVFGGTVEIAGARGKGTAVMVRVPCLSADER
jgi:PAS domain S-box-containing protein